MRRLLISAVSLMVPMTGGAQEAVATLDTVFADWRRSDAPGCVVGVDSHGTRTVRAYGQSNLEYSVPLGPESVMESGSVAKQFTAATVLLLAQQGKLSLDDDIRKHLPEVPDFGHTITIRHLLQHTSGLRDQWGLLAMQGHPPGEEVHTLPTILDLVTHQRALNFRPGEEYLYSNTGFALAAILVTRVAGQPFAQFSKERLFMPLGMTHTQWRDDYRRVVPARATAYARQGSGWVQDMPFTMVHGNGGLLTTMDDMLTWNAALTAGTVPGGMELVRQLEHTGTLNDGSPITYALGLTVSRYRGTREVSHGGSTAGYRTALARWPDRALSVAVFCNAANANPQRLARHVAEKLLHLPPAEAAPGPTVDVPTDVLQSLAGSYRDTTTDDRLTLAVTEGRLTAAAFGGPSFPLTPLGGMRFWNEVTGEFRVERGPSDWRVVRFDNAWRRFDRELPVAAAAVPLPDFVGRYRSEELDIVFDVRIESGRLMIVSPDATFPLMPAYRDGFAAAGRTFRFLRDATGRVNGMLINAGRVRHLRADRLLSPR